MFVLCSENTTWFTDPSLSKLPTEHVKPAILSFHTGFSFLGFPYQWSRPWSNIANSVIYQVLRVSVMYLGSQR